MEEDSKAIKVFQEALNTSNTFLMTEPEENKTTSRGLTPAVDGESFTIKRGYQFRPSTLRKLNKLKANHLDINVYLNIIIDEAIVHYYHHVINSRGTEISS